MDSSYVRPFIESTLSVWKTMLNMQVQIGQPVPAASIPSDSSNDVSGIIGLSGEITGSVILGFSTSTAEQAVTAFVGAPVQAGTEDFADAIGELVNMIAGNAKAKFEGKDVSISCPSVIMGGHHQVAMPSDASCICIPFDSPCGRFAVEVCLKLSNAGAKDRTAQAA